MLGRDMVKTNSTLSDLIPLENFKRWVRRNVPVLAGVAIVVASIITAVILVTRQSLKKGANLVTKQGKRKKDDDGESG